MSEHHAQRDAWLCKKWNFGVDRFFCLIPYSPAAFYKSVKNLMAQYAAFNPHATFRLTGEDETPTVFASRHPAWSKWTPNKPPSAHWYGGESFVGLIGAHLANDRMNGDGRRTTVREFLAEFWGLRSTQMQSRITAEVGLTHRRLDDLITEGEIDKDLACKLLDLMKGTLETDTTTGPWRIGKETGAGRAQPLGLSFL